MPNTRFEPGSWNVLCDRTGYKIKSSEAKKEWTGLIVRHESWEPRHPQDFVRGRRDRQSVPPDMNRPEVDDVFLTTNQVTVDSL